MSKYINLFQTHEEYEAYASGDTMILPNLSHCISEDEVHYTPRPNLCYMQVGSYYVLCGNNGKIHRGTNHGDSFYIGWTDGTTKLFHNMAASGNYNVISSVVSTYGVVTPQEITFSVTTTNNVSYLANNAFTWKGTRYVFSNGTWTPSIPGGEYIVSNSEVK